MRLSGRARWRWRSPSLWSRTSRHSAEAEPVADDVFIEETVVREERLITDEGVVEDVVTWRSACCPADGEVLEETVVQEDTVLVEEPVVDALEPAEDDLRARIEATRTEIETSLAEPFGGEALVEDAGEAAPADEDVVAEALGGESPSSRRASSARP